MAWHPVDRSLVLLLAAVVAVATTGCVRGSRGARSPSTEASGQAQLFSAEVAAVPSSGGSKGGRSPVAPADGVEEVVDEVDITGARGVEDAMALPDEGYAPVRAHVLPADRDAYAAHAAERLTLLDARARDLTQAGRAAAPSDAERRRREVAYRRYAAARNDVDAAITRLDREPDATWSSSRASVERALDVLESIVDAVHDEDRP